MGESEINDMREERDFRGVSFSNFKKTEVRGELLKSLNDAKVEPACYWSAELICAGHFMDLWDIILTFMSKYIHTANPRLPIYIMMRYDKFRELISTGYGGNEIRLRNNPQIRTLFAEMMCVLCNSKKNHKYDRVKIKKAEEFDMVTISQKLKAPTVEYAQTQFRSGDPKEIFIAVNEFAYHVSSDSKNGLLACYWLEWIIEFDALCKAKKETCRCERRSHVPVEDKMQFNPVWILWDIVLEQSMREGLPPMTKKIVNSLFTLFCIRFGTGVLKKRRYLMYFAISLVVNVYNPRNEIIENKEMVEVVTGRIHSVYKQIKKNEISPSTDYLFNGFNDKSDLDKTIKRLEMLNSMNTVIRSDSGGGGGGGSGNEDRKE